MDSSGQERNPDWGCCKHSNEFSGAVKGEQYLDRIIEKGSARLSLFIRFVQIPSTSGMKELFYFMALSLYYI